MPSRYHIALNKPAPESCFSPGLLLTIEFYRVGTLVYKEEKTLYGDQTVITLNVKGSFVTDNLKIFFQGHIVSNKGLDRMTLAGLVDINFDRAVIQHYLNGLSTGTWKCACGKTATDFYCECGAYKWD